MKIAFRDDEQRLRACRTLLAAGGVERLFTAHGPTREASALAEDASVLEPGPRALVRAAYALWKREPNALGFDDLVGLPEAEPLFKLAIASAYGPDAIDAWLARPSAEGYVCGRAEAEAAAAKLYDEARAVLAEHRDLPMNMGAAADACALGVLQMADYAMMMGMPVIEDDDVRRAEAMRVALRVLEMFATLANERARKK